MLSGMGQGTNNIVRIVSFNWYGATNFVNLLVGVGGNEVGRVIVNVENADPASLFFFYLLVCMYVLS